MRGVLTVALSAREQAELRLLLSLIALTAATGLAGVAVGRRSLALPAALLALASTAAWLRYDRRLEGPVLVELLPGHGLVLADLAAAPALVLLLVLLAQAARRPSARDVR